MPRDKVRLPAGVHRKVSRGRVYYYFVAGKTTDGKHVLQRLQGDLGTAEFNASLASAVIAKDRRGARAVVSITVKELVEKWQASDRYNKRSVNTRRAYEVYLPGFIDQFGHAPAEELERTDVARYLDTFGTRTGAANMSLAVIGSLYSWARKRGLVSNHPTRDIEKHDTEDYDPWPEDLLAAALVSDDAKVRRAVALLYYTAQRIGDVVAMRWTDIRDGRLFITQQKTRADLDFPIHADLRAIIGQPDRLGHILGKEDGTGFSASHIRKYLQAWALKRGHKVVPHGLRKNAVNALLEVGCSVGETSAISGQSLQLVEHYAKKRNRSRMGGAAILKWEGAKS